MDNQPVDQHTTKKDLKRSSFSLTCHRPQAIQETITIERVSDHYWLTEHERLTVPSFYSLDLSFTQITLLTSIPGNEGTER